MAGKEGMQAREVSVQSVQEVSVNFAGWGCPMLIALVKVFCS